MNKKHAANMAANRAKYALRQKCAAAALKRAIANEQKARLQAARVIHIGEASYLGATILGDALAERAAQDPQNRHLLLSNSEKFAIARRVAARFSLHVNAITTYADFLAAILPE